jgi:hypothetical protein
MRHFALLGRFRGEAAMVLAELEDHPELWDEHPFRTLGGPESPFDQTSDIWVRWRPLWQLTKPEHFREPHFAEWYPAWHALPSLHDVVFNLMWMVRATHLGGILITRIPAGEQVKPHTDAGGWHAEFYDTKVYLPLQTNERCLNWCEDEQVIMLPGEAWRFENRVMHGLINDGETDRISAIVCMKTEP